MTDSADIEINLYVLIVIFLLLIVILLEFSVVISKSMYLRILLSLR